MTPPPAHPPFDRPISAHPIYAFGLIAFVKHPALRGLYMKTHLCVEVSPCPTCDAEIGEPCRRVRRDGKWDHRSWVTDTHYARRDRMFGRKRP